MVVHTILVKHASAVAVRFLSDRRREVPLTVDDFHDFTAPSFPLSLCAKAKPSLHELAIEDQLQAVRKTRRKKKKSDKYAEEQFLSW